VEFIHQIRNVGHRGGLQFHSVGCGRRIQTVTNRTCKDLLGFGFKALRVKNYFKSSFVTRASILYQRESSKFSV